MAGSEHSWEFWPGVSSGPDGTPGSQLFPHPGLEGLHGVQGMDCGTNTSVSMSFLLETFPFGDTMPCAAVGKVSPGLQVQGAGSGVLTGLSSA